jgi:hypothetical protein
MYKIVVYKSLLKIYEKIVTCICLWSILLAFLVFQGFSEFFVTLDSYLLFLKITLKIRILIWMNIINNGEYFKINASEVFTMTFLFISFSSYYIITFFINRYIIVAAFCKASTILFLIHRIIIIANS